MTYSLADTYLTVSKISSSSQIKVKGSRFISHIFHANSQEDAEKYYLNIRNEHHDASHNCYAYRIDLQKFRYHDDGEPSGTAGRPILNIIEKHRLFQTLIIVSRYFGGTKLGTGGLIKAYSQAAKTVLVTAKIITKTQYSVVKLITDYEHINYLQNIIKKYHGHIGKSEFMENIKLRIQIPTSSVAGFKHEVNNILQNNIKTLDSKK